MNEEISYGWAGKILRVNLTTGEITTEPTKPYERDYIGGMGLANKLLFDDVPSGTDPYAPENELISPSGPSPPRGCPAAARCASPRSRRSPRGTWRSTAIAAA